MVSSSTVENEKFLRFEGTFFWLGYTRGEIREKQING